MSMNPNQIEALSSMLSGDNNNEDFESGGSSHPGRIGPPAPAEKNNPNAGVDPLFKTVIRSGPSRSSAAVADAPPQPPPKVDSRAIWSAEEIARARELPEDDVPDGRRKASYEILYLQHLSAEDTFMNMGMKDSSSRSCEGMVVRVSLPGVASMSEVQLDVTENRLMVRSNQLKLFLHLPHTVNEHAGRARWDARKETLSVTLPIVRRDDEL